MQTETKSKNIPNPKDLPVSRYRQILSSSATWAIICGSFAFFFARGMVENSHTHSSLAIVIIATLVFVYLFAVIGNPFGPSEKHRKLTADKNQITPITGRNAWAYHLLMFMLKLPRNIVLGIFGGFVAMMVFGGIFNNISSDSSATIGIAALILFPAWLSYRSSSKVLKKINASFLDSPAQIAAVLEKVDYFYLGIGLDVANKMLATNNIDDKYKVSETFKFGLDKIKNYWAFAPGHAVLSGVGLNATQSYQLETQNLSAKMKAKNKTGLYIDLDDIHEPRVFVEMNLDQAESWVLLLNKLFNGTLEEQSTAMLYPYCYTLSSNKSKAFAR